MKQYPYDWDDYVQAQIAANQRKQKMVWVDKRNIRLICDYVKSTDYVKSANTIVCHGTRNGRELQYFREHFPEAEIIGTEISPLGKNYPMTVCHDFHEPLGIRADVMYSNSLDHAFDPIKAIRTWLSETDLLFIEHSDCDFDDKVTEHDPFGASFEELEDLINREGEVIDILDAYRHIGAAEQKILVCRLRPNG